MKGRFIPKNPGKYLGNVNNIIFRSSWELSVLKFFDASPAVLRYGSEELAIPYIKPTDGRVHKYYPDFIAVIQETTGLQKYIIEVKPLKETVLTEKSSMHDKMSIIINTAKWAAAEAFCAQHGMKFKILTEEQIFHQVKRAPKQPRRKK